MIGMFLFWKTRKIKVGCKEKKLQQELNKYKPVIFCRLDMDPPCKVIIYEILPAFRLFLAKQLIKKHGYTQMEAASKMGITQAAISQYITAKRAAKGIIELDINYPLVESMAIEAAEKIAKNKMKPDEITTYFCQLCKTIKENNYCIWLFSKTF